METSKTVGTRLQFFINGEQRSVECTSHSETPEIITVTYQDDDTTVTVDYESLGYLKQAVIRAKLNELHAYVAEQNLKSSQEAEEAKKRVEEDNEGDKFNESNETKGSEEGEVDRYKSMRDGAAVCGTIGDQMINSSDVMYELDADQVINNMLQEVQNNKTTITNFLDNIQTILQEGATIIASTKEFVGGFDDKQQAKMVDLLNTPQFEPYKEAIAGQQYLIGELLKTVSLYINGSIEQHKTSIGWFDSLKSAKSKLEFIKVFGLQRVLKINSSFERIKSIFTK